MLGSCCSQSPLLPASQLGAEIHWVNLNVGSVFEDLGDSQVCHLSWWTGEPSCASGYMETEGGEMRAVWDKRMASWWQLQAGCVRSHGPLGWLPNRDQVRGFPSPTSCLWPGRGTAAPAPDLVLLGQWGCCGHVLVGRELTGDSAPRQVQGVGTDVTCGSWLQLFLSFHQSSHLFLLRACKRAKQLCYSKRHSGACGTKHSCHEEANWAEFKAAA